MCVNPTFDNTLDLERVNPIRGGRQHPLQSLEKLRKYKGGEQAPRNDNLALPKDVAVKPFSLKGLFNTRLSVLLSLMARGSNGLPGGHALPGLQHHSLERVLVVKVPAASFGPEVEEEETP